MSDYQLIFCARKVKRAKFNKHNNVFLRSLKPYTVNVFVEELQKVNVSNYERSFCIDHGDDISMYRCGIPHTTYDY